MSGLSRSGLELEDEHDDESRAAERQGNPPEQAEEEIAGTEPTERKGKGDQGTREGHGDRRRDADGGRVDEPLQDRTGVEHVDEVVQQQVLR